jgi:ribosome-associated protein
MELPPELLDAVLEAKRITSNGAIRRQRQHIGALMREVDVVPIRRALAALNRQRVQKAFDHNQIHEWRDALVAGNAETANTILNSYPACNMDHVLQLAGLARKEQELSSPPHHSRQLYRYLRDLTASRSPADMGPSV